MDVPGAGDCEQVHCAPVTNASESCIIETGLFPKIGCRKQQKPGCMKAGPSGHREDSRVHRILAAFVLWFVYRLSITQKLKY